MKISFAILLIFAAMSSPAFAIDVPVYPGAKSNEMLTKADRENQPGSFAYTTSDSFESVYDFYKKIGNENPHMKTNTPYYKAAAFTFPGKKFQVAIYWQKEQGKLGTMVHLINMAE